MRFPSAVEGTHVHSDDLLRDRCLHYRMMARDALRRAEASGSAVQREELFSLALGWHALAVQIEESLFALEQQREPAA